MTDPVKRSQAINSIVESISKIKNQITRASYITDCSHRLGVNEAIIVNALNNFVRNGMSEQVKAERRAAGLKDSPVAAAQQAQSAMRAVTPLDKLLEVEGLLVQLIIHHGDQLITVQDVDGNDVEVAVAQYISLDLGGDGFKFHNDLYNQIMQEAVEHLEKEDDFVAETYFANHPNPEISRLAGLPTGDQEVSTASLQMKMSADKLRQFVFKDILSFRTHYIAQRIIEAYIIVNRLSMNAPATDMILPGARRRGLSRTVLYQRAFLSPCGRPTGSGLTLSGALRQHRVAA